MYTRSGDSPGAAPSCHTCSKLSKTEKLKGNTFDSDTGSFDLTDCGLVSGKGLVNETSTEREDPQPLLLTRAAPSCCTSSTLSETTSLKVDSETGSLELAGSGLDSISYLRMSSAGDTTYTGSGDPPNAAPSCYTYSKLGETDAEFEEAAARCDQDSLLERAIMTGWKRYEEGERDVDELVAITVEAIEGDVKDYDMCIDLIQTTQEVFDHVVFQ